MQSERDIHDHPSTFNDDQDDQEQVQRPRRQPLLGMPVLPNRSDRFVMTEREAHEAWAKLIFRKPRAAALLHMVVSKMGHQNALVASQKTLAKMMDVTDRTIRSAIADLVEDRWLTVVSINGPGTVCAYIVNDQVVWGQPRDQLHLSLFSAAVIADRDDQKVEKLLDLNLRKIPVLYSGEKQLPTGAGLEPPSQPAIDGLEPDLPALAHRHRPRDPIDLELDEAVREIENDSRKRR